MARRTEIALVLAWTTVALAGCSNNRVSALLSHEKQLIRNHVAQKIGASPTELSRAFDDSAANEIRTAREISARVEHRIGVSGDIKMRAHLQAIAEKLAEPLDSINGNIEVVLLDDSEINAFTPGGGKILIKQGLLSLCDTEAQIAAVLAHELAHIAMRHPRALKKVSLARRAGDRFVEAVLPESLRDGVTEKVMRNSGRATLNVFVRNQEYQADAVGIDLMVVAGYEPRAMVQLQRNLQFHVKQLPRFTNVIYGNHPLSEDRAAEAEKRIARYYGAIQGRVSTKTYDELVKPYIARRATIVTRS